MKKKVEFSKLIMMLVMLTYFVGLGFGVYVILQLLDMSVSYTSVVSTALCGLFSYIGAPVAVAIGFYHSKAKAENVVKIQNNIPCGNEDIPSGGIPEEHFDEESDF